MISSTLKALWKSLDAPDEVRGFSNGRIELVHLADVTIGRVTLRPGWKWSKDLKPIVKTESCEAPHTQYVISGRLLIAMDDGTRSELKAGDAAVIPPGHDAWVLGDEPFIAIDFTGLKDYARRA